MDNARGVHQQRAQRRLNTARAALGDPDANSRRARIIADEMLMCNKKELKFVLATLIGW